MIMHRYLTSLKVLMATGIVCFLNPLTLLADEASVLCVNKFDGSISKAEKRCEVRIKSDDKYARKKRVYLWGNFPDCDMDKNEYIQGNKEEICALDKKRDKYEEQQRANRALAKDYPHCDGVDGKGILHKNKRDGEISGRGERKCVRGIRVLMSAVRKGSVDSLKAALAKGVDTELRNKKGNTALIIAGFYNNTKIIKLLLTAGADINAQSSDGGNTALMNASSKGNIDAVKLLLEKGANFNKETKGEYKYKAIYFAIENGRYLIVKELLAAGDKLPAGHIQFAAIKPINIKLLGLIIKSGIEIDTPNHHGGTLLSLAVSNKKTEDKTCINVIQLLRQIGSNTNRDPDLCNRSKGNNIKAVKLLIAANANINRRDHKGTTPLMIAAAYGSDADIVKVLLESGSDIHVKNMQHETALHLAARNPQAGSIDIVNTLIQAGADVNAQYRKNGKYSPLHYAVANQYQGEKITRVLLEAGANIHAKELIHSAGYNTFDMLSLLINKGVDLEAKDDSGGSALQAFAGNKDPRTVRLLLDLGADVKARTDSGFAVLHSVRGVPETALELIKAGAQVNARTDFGRTPLHEAIFNLDVLKVLLDAGADRSIKDNDGYTALDRARKNWRDEKDLETKNEYQAVIDLLEN